AREGTDEAWEALVDFVESHDLGAVAHYDHVAARIDVANFIDAAILFQYFEFSAETLVAVQPDGGRWFWILEGGGKEVTGQSDISVLFQALISNAEFRQRFQRRLAQVLNTALAPSHLQRHLDDGTAALAADFDYERARWPGVPTWHEAVATYEMWMESRSTEMLDIWAGPTVTLTLSRAPERGGRVYVDGHRVSEGLLPGEGAWKGRYPIGAEIQVIAVPASGYGFAGWQTQDGVVASTALTVSLTSSQSLSAVFDQDLGGIATDANVPDRVGCDGTRADDVVINELWINDDGTRYPSLGYRPLEGDWVELLVRCPGLTDLRGWRLTDNDTKAGTSEGSVIFPEIEALAEVPCGTVILIVATESEANAAAFPADDLDARDGQMVFYVGAGTLDVETDPGFRVGTGEENVVLLSPGPTAAFGDDVGVDFVAEGEDVTPYSFGVLADGVTFDTPFRYLGDDDGAVFVRRPTQGNDDITGWVVDPSACESYDARCLGAAHLVTPGALNPGQQGYRWQCRLFPASCRTRSR
ncbi:MAG: CotH kinase family protein, partial [Anaerolineae bacterium]